MAAVKKNKRKKTSQPEGGNVQLSLKPDTRVQITIETGRVRAGKMPVTMHVEELGATRSVRAKRPQGSANVSGRLRGVFEALESRLGAYDLPAWLFIGAIILYLTTRLIGLTQYPIYFFTDEAIQTQALVDLINRDYRDVEGTLLPTYFKNGEYSNLSLSVYLQWIPLLLFGKSAVVTRATSVLVTMIAAISLGIVLRDVFRMKYWWTATLFLSITPSWFLHSRTAFETAEFTAFFAGTLCAYLLYRYKSPRYIYLTFLMAACAFYSYSPAQLIVPLTTLALFLSDWRYHWENRAAVGGGLILLVVLAMPFIRFRFIDPDNAMFHLHTLGSYLLEDVPVSVKVMHYLSEYLTGLSAWYWYIPNDRDFTRHLMGDYGNIMLWTLPFAIGGLAYAIYHIRESCYRAVLIAFLTAPVAGALVQTGITRALIFVIPAALFTAIGLEFTLRWLTDPNEELLAYKRGPGFTKERITLAARIFIVGILVALVCTRPADGAAVLVLAALLALAVGGTGEWLAARVKRTRSNAKLKKWKLSNTFVALAVFIGLAFANIHLLVDALRNGPTWETDYGLGGMQYGAFQIFDVIGEYKQQHPDTTIILTPNWANGADIVARFFLGDPLPFQMGSIQGYIAQEFHLDESMLFVMIDSEYKAATESGMFKNIEVEKTFPYPDGTPGFYFVRLLYSDEAAEVFAAEKAMRSVLQESVIKIDGEDVRVRHTYLEAGEHQNQAIQLVFDGDPYSLAKTFEANPFVIELTYPSVREFNDFSIIVGAAKVAVTLKFYSAPGVEPVTYRFEGEGQTAQPQLSFELPESVSAQMVYIEMLDVNAVMPTKDHIWEITLR